MKQKKTTSIKTQSGETMRARNYEIRKVKSSRFDNYFGYLFDCHEFRYTLHAMVGCYCRVFKWFERKRLNMREFKWFKWYVGFIDKTRRLLAHRFDGFVRKYTRKSKCVHETINICLPIRQFVKRSLTHPARTSSTKQLPNKQMSLIGRCNWQPRSC